MVDQVVDECCREQLSYHYQILTLGLNMKVTFAALYLVWFLASHARSLFLPEPFKTDSSNEETIYARPSFFRLHILFYVYARACISISDNHAVAPTIDIK